MRINNNSPATPIAGTENAQRQERIGSDKSARPDQIQLSNVASASAGAHSDKIENLKLRVSNGSYRVSADQIAGSIVDEMMR